METQAIVVKQRIPHVVQTSWSMPRPPSDATHFTVSWRVPVGAGYKCRKTRWHELMDWRTLIGKLTFLHNTINTKLTE